MRPETFKFWDLIHLIIEVWQYSCILHGLPSELQYCTNTIKCKVIFWCTQDGLTFLMQLTCISYAKFINSVLYKYLMYGDIMIYIIQMLILKAEMYGDIMIYLIPVLILKVEMKTHPVHRTTHHISYHILDGQKHVYSANIYMINSTSTATENELRWVPKDLHDMNQHWIR